MLNFQPHRLPRGSQLSGIWIAYTDYHVFTITRPQMQDVFVATVHKRWEHSGSGTLGQQPTFAAAALLCEHRALELRNYLSA